MPVMLRFLTITLLVAACRTQNDAVYNTPVQLNVESTPNVKWDPEGYILFCPCMGRFGNQAEHYLGALRVAKEINRTIILPPWRTYKNVPFTDWFKLGPVQQFHRAIPAEDFMQYLAPQYWPPEKRVGFCWNFPGRQCKMKDGNPFGPFWDGLGVDFVEELTYQLDSDMDNPRAIAQWRERFPADQYPVLALKGAPAKYPVAASNRLIQKYLVWSDAIEEEVEKYVKENIPEGPFVGIHLRNGPDWVKACDLTGKTGQFFASTQCLNSSQSVTMDLCLPSTEEIVSHTRAAVEKLEATTVYVATDSNPLLVELKRGVEDLNVKVIHQDPWLPQSDLAVLGRADHFIGNCVSSFTAFVKRERDVNGRTTTFWGLADQL